MLISLNVLPRPWSLDVLFRLLLLFVVVPLVDLALLLLLAEYTGWWVSVLVVIVTGTVGSMLAHSQGIRVFWRIRQDWLEGRMPAEALLDGLMIFVAGALLLAPGMITDLVGITLLTPFCRWLYRRQLMRWFRNHVTMRVTTTTPSGTQEYLHNPSQVIDSYVVPEPPPAKPKRQSKRRTKKEDSA